MRTTMMIPNAIFAVVGGVLLLSAAQIVNAFNQPMAFMHRQTRNQGCTDTIASSSRLVVLHQEDSFKRRTTSSALFARRGGGNRGRQDLPKQQDMPTMNNEISAAEVRVMMSVPGSEKDESLGIMSRDDALAKATDVGLDLILINEKADPPVCKIAEVQKYLYDKQKKDKESKKKGKSAEIKEVKMSYKIDVHDFEVRKNQAEKFVNQGNRVKVSVEFRGREMEHLNLGYELMDKLKGELEAIATVDGRPKTEGRRLSAFFSPRQEVLRSLSEERKSEEKAKKKKKKEAMKKKEEAKAESLGRGSVMDEIAALEQDEANLLRTLTLDDDDDEEDDIETSLDALLGSDDLTENLFK